MCYFRNDITKEKCADLYIYRIHIGNQQLCELLYQILRFYAQNQIKYILIVI